MKAGQYILDRLLPELVQAAAQRHGITCDVMSDGWVLRLARNDVVRWVVGYQFDVNRAAASAVAQDKVATYLLLQTAGIPAVPHMLIRSVPHAEPNMTALASLPMGPIVLKPLDGTSGRGVCKVTDTSEVVAHIVASPETAWAVSPCVDIAAEYRVVVLDSKAVLVYEKTQPATHGGLKFFNLGMGAVAEPIADPALQARLESLAIRVCNFASLRLAAVDIVVTAANETLILEINDGMMMENYARQSPQNKTHAATIYDAIVEAMFH